MSKFISEVYLKTFIGIDQSIDNNIIEPAIKRAQLFQIKDLLGTALYDELDGQVALGTASISVDNKVLLNQYVAPTLASYAYFEMLPALMYKVENNSIFKRKSESADPIDEKAYAGLRALYLDNAERFADRLKLFLEAHTSVYPLYLRPGNSIDTRYPETGSIYTTSIHFPKR
ncbi:MAG TPA: hypothetical protein VF868_15260 [Bacteroidia bacterium]|jgi:hypothetical protein